MYGRLDRVNVISGNSNRELTAKICDYLGIKQARAEIRRFADGESNVRIVDIVRNTDVFIIQSITKPVNDNLMELLIMIDTVKRAASASITVIVPYYGYGRNDIRNSERTAIGAKLVAEMLAAAGAERIVSIDLHANQIQGFFNIPVDNMYGAREIMGYLKTSLWRESFNPMTQKSNIIVVSPDASGSALARSYAKRLDARMAIVDKRGARDEGPEIVNVVGKVNDKDALLFDDMVDTANNLSRAAEAVMRLGANRVWATCTHPVLSEGAVQKIEESPIEKLLVTDTIPLSEEAKNCSKIVTVSVSKLLGEVVKRLITDASISELFKI